MEGKNSALVNKGRRHFLLAPSFFGEEGSFNPRLPRSALTWNPVVPGAWGREPNRRSQAPGSQGYSIYMLETLKIEVYL